MTVLGCFRFACLTLSVLILVRSFFDLFFCLQVLPWSARGLTNKQICLFIVCLCVCLLFVCFVGLFVLFVCLFVLFVCLFVCLFVLFVSLLVCLHLGMCRVAVLCVGCLSLWLALGFVVCLFVFRSRFLDLLVFGCLLHITPCLYPCMFFVFGLLAF